MNPNSEKTKSKNQTGRKVRLAGALRSNLLKRKAQAKARKSQKTLRNETQG